MMNTTSSRSFQPIREATARAVERAVAAFRRGEIVAVSGTDGALAAAVSTEMLSEEVLGRLRRLTRSEPHVAVTGRRAAILGMGDAESSAVRLTARGGVTASAGRALADPAGEGPTLPDDIVAALAPEESAVSAAVELARLARLLPAAAVAEVAGVPAGAGAAWAERHDLLFLAVEDLRIYRKHGPRTLHPVAEARVPLESAENVRIVAFRPADGGPEHLAIIVGDLDPSVPVLVRLHSECFTGDLLGSLRCDCGDQLRGALKEIAEAGSGVILYLAQEGRGIGLVNKLRAYRIQDQGVDTIDANEILGFDADERIYLPAAEMLRQLGVGQVRLMTNNPDKLRELASHGVEVVERVPHVFPASEHSAFYLRTKAERSGHLF